MSTSTSKNMSPAAMSPPVKLLWAMFDNITKDGGADEAAIADGKRALVNLDRKLSRKTKTTTPAR